MWLLVRGPGTAAGEKRLLASAPDGAPSPDARVRPATLMHPESWCWDIDLTANGAVEVRTDPDHVESEEQSLREAFALERDAGTIVAIVGQRGAWRISTIRGPWAKTIGPGDLLLTEGADAEHLRIEPSAEETDDHLAHMVRLRPASGAAALRWIP